MIITPRLLKLFELANELTYSVHVNRQVWGKDLELRVRAFPDGDLNKDTFLVDFNYQKRVFKSLLSFEKELIKAIDKQIEEQEANLEKLNTVKQKVLMGRKLKTVK